MTDIAIVLAALLYSIVAVFSFVLAKDGIYTRKDAVIATIEAFLWPLVFIKIIVHVLLLPFLSKR